MVLRTKAAGKQSARRGFQHGILAAGAVYRLTLLAAALLLLGACAGATQGQQPGASPGGLPGVAAPAGTAQSVIEPALQPAPPAAQPSADWIGKQVEHIRFEGVSAGRLEPLAGQLAQIEGGPLTAAYLENSLRRLYATGLYDTLAVEGVREANGVDLIFRGRPRTFIGIVSVYGAKGATVNTQLESVSQLRPGTRFTTEKLQRAIAQMRDILAEDGFHTPTIEPNLTPHPDQQLVDIVFHVTSGWQARVGDVQVTGDSGMSVKQFRRYAHLRAGSRVTHDTVDHALSGVLKHYQKQERFEAEVRLESAQYVPGTKRVNFSFSASRGPVVHVEVEGASIEEDDLKRLVPIYQEGAVDEDLLNEGNRRLRDFYQRQGYFDVKVNHTEHSTDNRQVTILFTVNLGPRRRVERVSITGNDYFDTDTLEDLLNVHAANVLDRHGAYSQALVAADEAALQSVYHNNGFPNVKVTAQTSTPPDSEQSRRARAKTAPLIVTYHIDEGQQQRVGAVRIEGNHRIDTAMLTPLMNTIPGQLFSLRNLAGDRNALLTEYLSRGFEHAAVDVTEHTEKAPPA